jgi:hypothetical protein
MKKHMLMLCLGLLVVPCCVAATNTDKPNPNSEPTLKAGSEQPAQAPYDVEKAMTRIEVPGLPKLSARPTTNCKNRTCPDDDHCCAGYYCYRPVGAADGVCRVN